MFRLVSVSGGGRVNSSGDLATVTVRQSDDPVSIMTEGLFVRGEEGETLTINVTRGGRANGREREGGREGRKEGGREREGVKYNVFINYNYMYYMYMYDNTCTCN